jgi:glyoxylase-like metal-dependent hydrolase (beta-lactamase superfamily II)
MKITDGVYQIGGSGISHPSDAAVYLVSHEGESFLVDAGTGGGTDRILSAVSECGIDPHRIKYLFLTHCHYDHTGGADEIRKLTGCSIVCHHMDAVYLESGDQMVTAAEWYRAVISPFKIDIKVNADEEEFSAGGQSVKFIHTPGHSPGSSVLLWESAGGLVLFGQDVHGPLNDSLLSSRVDYLRSLRKMIEMRADILCEGHFGVIEGKDSVREFIESYL